MAKIFFEFSSGIGPLIRCLPIALELKKRGHAINYFAHNECRRYMDKFGFEHIDINVSVCQNPKASLRNDWIDADEYWSSFGFSNYEWLSKETKLWLNELENFKPDIIVSDIGVFSSIVARILKIPLATITQSCYHPRIYHEIQGYWMHKEICSDTLDAINKLLASYHTENLEKFEKLFLGNITLIPSIPEFDKLKEVRKSDNTYYTGPILWDGFLECPAKEFSFRLGNAPAVFCYAGQLRDNSGDSSGELIHALMEVSENSNINIVISTGNPEDMKKLQKNIPDNIKVIDWLPIQAAHENRALVINHGGHGSCMGLLKYGVPGLILATHTEREYNGRLVEQLGTGICLGKCDFQKDKILDSIDKLLHDSSYMKNAGYYKELIKTGYKDGEKIAAEKILMLL